jgi:hypothetical protein
MPSYFWVDLYSFMIMNETKLVIYCEIEYLFLSMFQVNKIKLNFLIFIYIKKIFYF